MNAINAKNALPDKIIEYGLIFLIIFTPLAFGSVHIWAYTIVEVVVLLLLLTALLAPRSLPPALSPSPLADSSLLIAKNHDPRAISHEPRSSLLAPRSSPPASSSPPFARIKDQGLRVKEKGADIKEEGYRLGVVGYNLKPTTQDLTPNPQHFTPHVSHLTEHTSRFSIYAALPLLLFLGLILFQMVPIPATAIKYLSPNTYDLYQQTLGNGGEQGARIKEQGNRLWVMGDNLKPTTQDLRPNTYNLTPNTEPFTLHASRPSPLADSSLLIAKNHEPRTSLLVPRSLSIYSQATKTEFLKFFVYVSVFFLIITFMTTFQQIRRLVLTIIFTGTGVAFLALCQMLGKSDKIYGFWQSQYKVGNYGGPFINANHLAGYLEMVIPLALGFLVSREVPGIIRAAKNWKQRLSLLETWLAKNVLLIFIIVLMASALFISASRGGILSFVFSLGLFSLLLGTQKSRKGKRKLVLLISGLLLIFLLWMGVGPVVTKFATLADPKTPYGERPQVWKDTMRLVRDFPVFGVGLGNFQTLYPKYKTIITPVLWEHAHNDYVEMLADTGWVGLLLFFGGIWFLLFFTIKKWKRRRDPFAAGITLGGFIGAISLLCHCLVEFNLHIPANAFLLFVVLGLSVAAVNLKQNAEVPVRTHFFSQKIRTTIVMVSALMVVFLLTLVMKDYLGYRFFSNYQSLGKEEGIRLWVMGDNLKPTTQDLTPNTQHFTPHASRFTEVAPRSSLLVPLRRAIFFDSGNAQYRYELGNYYARQMSEAWKQGAWTLQGERWVFNAENNIRFFGLKALQAYADAVNLCPANAWYHFYRGWTLSELKRFSDFSHHPIRLSEPLDAETEFSRALMLDPNNKDIKKYVNAVKRKK